MTRPLALSRREFLFASAALLFQPEPNEEILPWADRPDPFAPAGRPGVRFTDLSKVVTPHLAPSDFFVLQHQEIPRVEPRDWKLSVGGSAFSIQEIRQRPSKRLAVAFECAGNGGHGMHGLVGCAEWEGAPLAPLLREIGVPGGTRDVVFEGADFAEERLRQNRYPAPFARSLPVEDALGDDVLLAYAMGGEPLTEEHGAPLRLIAPGFYGIAQVKWLERIELTPTRFMGWFMAKDYVTVRGVERDGVIEHRATSVSRMRLKSIVTRVTRVTRKDSEIRLHGLAWSDGSPIDAVEVRIDGGSFEPARLEPRASNYEWTRFSLPWRSPAPGEHRLVSRARSGNNLQPTEAEASHLKATPWENDGQIERRIVLP